MLLTMPRIIHRAVLSEQGNAILTAAPKRAVLVHIPDNDAVVLRRIRIGRIEVLVGDSRPAHTAFAGAVDNTRVDLAEAGFDVVVEPRTDIDTSRPHLNVADDVVRVVRRANMEPNEIVELETLAGAYVSWVMGAHTRRVILYLEPPVCPRPIFHFNPREVHGANVGRSTLREYIVSLELAHIRVRWSTRGR